MTTSKSDHSDALHHGKTEKDSNERAITSIRDGTDIGEIMAAAGSGRRQSLQGFDEDYTDIVDYIIRCTHKIWEEKGIGLIYTHYKHNAIIHTSDGITYGRDKIIEDSIMTMAAFPDVRLYGDDVIWSGDDQRGFHTSHRITWVAHNTGHSIYGPPTGRKVVRQGIAHCLVKENRIIEEWIVRDELALVRQLGFDPIQLAVSVAAREAMTGHNPIPEAFGEVIRLQGQEPPPLHVEKTEGMHEVEHLVRHSIQEIWNGRLLNKIPVYYVPGYHARVPSSGNLYGMGEYQAHVLRLLAAFPDLAITVHHVCLLGAEPEGFRVATRWMLQGTHTGPGPYGPPSGRRVRLWGITHQEVQKGKFVREWTVYDEFALLKQIYAPRPVESVSHFE